MLCLFYDLVNLEVILSCLAILCLIFAVRLAVVVAIRLVTTARFVIKVTKRAAMSARFVTNEVATNRAGIAPFFPLGYQYV